METMYAIRIMGLKKKNIYIITIIIKLVKKFIEEKIPYMC